MDVAVVLVCEGREIDEVYAFSSKTVAEIWIDRRLREVEPEVNFSTFEVTLDGAIERILRNEALG